MSDKTANIIATLFFGTLLLLFIVSVWWSLLTIPITTAEQTGISAVNNLKELATYNDCYKCHLHQERHVYDYYRGNTE